MKILVFLGFSASLFEENTIFLPFFEKTGKESKVSLFVSLVRVFVAILINFTRSYTGIPSLLCYTSASKGSYVTYCIC